MKKGKPKEKEIRLLTKSERKHLNLDPRVRGVYVASDGLYVIRSWVDYQLQIHDSNFSSDLTGRFWEDLNNYWES
jgi:hypothetical protein